MYLLQLASNYSSNSDTSGSMIIFINFAILTEYAILLYINILSVKTKISYLSLMKNSEDMAPRFQEALNLKHKQLRMFHICLHIFYWPRIIYQGYTVTLVALQDTNQYQQLWAMVAMEGLDLISIGFFIWTFRPREAWPECYSLVDERFLNDTVNRTKKKCTECKLKVCDINDEHLFDQHGYLEDDSELDKIPLNQPIVIINPCDVTAGNH